MRDLIEHPESGLMLDFAEDDFGGAEQSALIIAWRKRERKSHESRSRKGEFICYRHRDYERPWFYLREDDGQLIAAHWPGTALAGTHEISHGVSDEHKREVEYIQRAANAAGLNVATEVRLSTRVIPDAVIYGPRVHLGVEVQRSALTAVAAKARTTKARRAGVESVWFSDRSPDRLPKWFYSVPSVGMNPDVPWDRLPRPRGVTVTTGVRVIKPARCRDIPNSLCPDRRRGCNRWHPTHWPRGGTCDGLFHQPDCRCTFVDDLAELMPAGNLVPMLYRTLTGRPFIFIVSPVDKARYESLAQRSADIPVRPQRTPSVAQDGRRDCLAGTASTGVSRPIHRPLVVAGPQPRRPQLCAYGCGEPARLYPCGWRCDAHRPGMVRA